MHETLYAQQDFHSALRTQLRCRKQVPARTAAAYVLFHWDPLNFPTCPKKRNWEMEFSLQENTK